MQWWQAATPASLSVLLQTYRRLTLGDMAKGLNLAQQSLLFHAFLPSHPEFLLGRKLAVLLVHEEGKLVLADLVCQRRKTPIFQRVDFIWRVPRVQLSELVNHRSAISLCGLIVAVGYRRHWLLQEYVALLREG